MNQLRNNSTKPSRNVARLSAFVALVLALGSISLLSAQKSEAYPPTIVFMTDFGVVDDSVALCRGVMYSIMPTVRIVDLTHQVTPFSILDGARFLSGSSPYYPAGTVFVVVIDPGVGSTRKAIVAKTKRGQYFVLPDNGLMTFVEQRDGIESAREITNTNWMLGSKLSSTFHGRDIFSPVGAHLARGDNWADVGPEVPVAKLVRLDVKAATLDEHDRKPEPPRDHRGQRAGEGRTDHGEVVDFGHGISLSFSFCLGDFSGFRVARRASVAEISRRGHRISRPLSARARVVRARTDAARGRGRGGARSVGRTGRGGSGDFSGRVVR